MAVHVLGNSTNMNALMKIVKKYKLILIEDTCNLWVQLIKISLWELLASLVLILFMFLIS